MHFDLTNPHNYNGFIHPVYISHLEPLIKHREVTISDARVPDADAIEWATLGMLDSLSPIGGTTSMEALVIKGQGSRLVNFLSTVNASSSPYYWLSDYYLGSPEESVSVLMSAMTDPSVMFSCTGLVAAICIQDLGFDNDDELRLFIAKNARSWDSNLMLDQIDHAIDHYRSDPESISEFEDGILPCDLYEHIDCARMWAKLGEEENVRRNLETAECMKEYDSFLWRSISQSYQKLLGDFEKAEYVHHKSNSYP